MSNEIEKQYISSNRYWSCGPALTADLEEED